MATTPNLFNLDPLAFRLSRGGGAFRRLRQEGPQKLDASGVSQVGSSDAVLAQIRQQVAAQQRGQVNAGKFATRQQALADQTAREKGSTALSVIPYAKYINMARSASGLAGKVDQEGIRTAERIGGPIADAFADSAGFSSDVNKSVFDLMGDLQAGFGSLLGLGGKMDRDTLVSIQDQRRAGYGQNVASSIFKLAQEANPNATMEDLVKAARTEAVRLAGIQTAQNFNPTGDRQGGPRTELSNRLADLAAGRSWGEYKAPAPVVNTGRRQDSVSSPSRIVGLGEDYVEFTSEAGIDKYLMPYIQQSAYAVEAEKRKAAAEEAQKQILAARDLRAQEVEAQAVDIPTSMDVRAGTSLYSDDLSQLVSARKG